MPMPPTRKASGFSDHPLRATWHQMMRRCYVENSPRYKIYGARGIKVDERWHDLANFIKDVHPKPSPEMQLDRIDNDGNYSPANTRWVSVKENARNKRTTLLLKYKGAMMTIQEIAEDIGIPPVNLWNRLRRGTPDPFSPAKRRKKQP